MSSWLIGFAVMWIVSGIVAAITDDSTVMIIPFLGSILLGAFYLCINGGGVQ
tara:strand:- start:65978 stop:66133 length:156 start_codon:yes stop_codon:yes gene_type:complete